ncbi:hypothetical protein [uncultured Methanobrevibacter sp.]|uniref:hypothetical protein n=1 Tax=uncultured Methanobrevibacter sp. TaxID=253161 RepID=UPI0025F2C3C5|nr:hypothetical protein [uncultured Methanobrevibacter sp.]
MSIFYLLLLSIFNLLGFKSNEPQKLHKKESMRVKINRWAYVHQYELLLIITVLMMVIFVLVAFAVVPPMDLWNNHFEEVI